MIVKRVLRAVYEVGLMAGISVIWTANLSGQAIQALIEFTNGPERYCLGLNGWIR
jgi:hypothetical protein